MAHFANDVHHRLSTRIRDIIPDFVESEYPAFVSFVTAYYEFLEQYDDQPVASTYTPQSGVVTVRSGNSTIIGANTQFSNTSIYANNVQLRVGSDQFRIRSVTNNNHVIVYEVPVRSYFANTHTVETNKSIRQASGTLRQLLTTHDVEHTLDDFVAYFRDTYLRDIPRGLTDTTVLIPRILDFYQSRGSEASYQFLFRSLYGKDVEFSYPRESVFTTSDNEWVKPTILRLDYDQDDSVTGNVALIETREIVGQSSNAHATVLQAVQAFEGDRRVVRLFISEPVVAQELGGLLLEDGTGVLVATMYGVPPEGLASIVYEFALVQEFVTATTFQAGETISTVPPNDPEAITGQLLGSITGFVINQRGSGYQLGDLIYPPSRYANGVTATGGFGAVGRVSAFTDTDLTQLNINDPGLGYYEGLPLIIDNSGTGGGFGLSGYVDKISSGNILISHDGSGTTNSIADGDTLTFTWEEDGLDYGAERQSINYYEVGISLVDLLTADPPITLDEPSWSINASSALFGTNLQTTIIGLTSNLSVYPVYVNGARTALGEVFSVAVDSFGQGYVAGLPTIIVQPPVAPTADEAGVEPLSYNQIFGTAFRPALITAQKETGQLGQVDVIVGGSGYSNVAFTVNTSTSTTTSGSDAELALTLGAVSSGAPYFRNTRSFTSADQYLQDITKYQPFSYVMTVEEDLSRYATVLKRLLHPSGGLLLPRQTITTEIDSTSIITFGGMDLTFTIAEDLNSTPQSIKTITVSAPSASLAITLFVGSVPSSSALLNVQPASGTLHITMRPSTDIINITNEETTVQSSVAVAVNVSGITISNEEESQHIIVPIDSAHIGISNEEEELYPGNVDTPAPTSTVSLSAPVVSTDITVNLFVVFDTEIAPYETQELTGYETAQLLSVVDWNPPVVDISAPTAVV